MAKHALLFVGEVALTDATLTAAAGLRLLARLDLSTVSISDSGFASLVELPHLTQLSLRGQLAVGLDTLGKVFAAVTQLQQLDMGCLLPRNKDLKYIAAAHSSQQQASSSSSSDGGGSRSRSSRSRSSMSRNRGYIGSSNSSSNSSTRSFSSSQSQQQQQQKPCSYGGWSSSRLWQQQEHAAAARQRGSSSSSSHAAAQLSGAASAAAGEMTSSSSNGSSRLNSSSHIGSPASALTPIPAETSTGSSSSSRRSRRWAPDWTAVLLPLRRLRVLKLQSDLVFLGSCAALRSMGHVTHIELRGAATFMQGSPLWRQFAALPPSWLTQLSRDAAAPAAAAAAGGGSGNCSGSSGREVLRAGGAWPGLVSLHCDNLQLADGFIQGVSQLVNLEALVVSGPCLLAAQQRQQQAEHHHHHHHSPVQQQQQRQQQRHHSGPTPGWNSAFGAQAGLADLPGLSALSSALPSKHKASPSWVAEEAAALEALGGLGFGYRSPGSTSSSSTSTISSSTASTISSSSSGSRQPLFNASGMQPPQQQQLLLPAAMAGLAALPPIYQQQESPPVFSPLMDADALTCLSPLSKLAKFELHLQQQQLPCGRFLRTLDCA